MIFRLIIWMTSLCLVGCSNTPATLNQKSDSAPKWTEDPYLECSKAWKICAVGEGTGLRGATTNAQQQIAEQILVTVKGTSTYSQNMQQTESEGEIENGSHSEQFYQQHISEVNETLQGIQVRKSFNNEDKYYVLVELDKRDQVKYWGAKIHRIDTEINDLAKKNTIASLAKIKRLLNHRFLMDQRYTLFKGSSYPPPPLGNLGQNLVPIVLNVKWDNSLPPLFKGMIQSLLTQMGYHLSANGEKHQYIVKVKGNKARGHLNVDGFEKWIYSIELGVYEKNNTEIFYTAIKKEGVGRSEAHVREDLHPEVRDQLILELENMPI